VWYLGKGKSIALITYFTSGRGNTFFTGSDSRGAVRGRDGRENINERPGGNSSGYGSFLSGSEIDEVF
jgi:hypothetical protein